MLAPQFKDYPDDYPAEQPLSGWRIARIALFCLFAVIAAFATMFAAFRLFFWATGVSV